MTISTFTSVHPSGGSVMFHFLVLSCSECQKPSQTTAERGFIKLCILNFRTTWPEFQKPHQTAAVRGEAVLCMYNLKETSPPKE